MQCMPQRVQPLLATSRASDCAIESISRPPPSRSATACIPPLRSSVHSTPSRHTPPAAARASHQSRQPQRSCDSNSSSWQLVSPSPPQRLVSPSCKEAEMARLLWLANFDNALCRNALIPGYCYTEDELVRGCVTCRGCGGVLSRLGRRSLSHTGRGWMGERKETRQGRDGRDQRLAEAA